HVGAYAADRGDGNNAFHAKRLQRPEVGAVIHLVRRNRVPVAVAREKGDLAAVEPAVRDRPGRFTERRVHHLAAKDFQLGKTGETRPADDRDFGHAGSCRYFPLPSAYSAGNWRKCSL